MTPRKTELRLGLAFKVKTISKLSQFFSGQTDFTNKKLNSYTYTVVSQFRPAGLIVSFICASRANILWNINITLRKPVCFFRA